jgi:hypothetical protein
MRLWFNRTGKTGSESRFSPDPRANAAVKSRKFGKSPHLLEAA